MSLRRRSVTGNSAAFFFLRPQILTMTRLFFIAERVMDKIKRIKRSEATWREIFSRQKQEGFCFDVEDLLIAKKLGLRAVEVPVRWANVEGTKVRLTQGMMSFVDLVKIRMSHNASE